MQYHSKLPGSIRASALCNAPTSAQSSETPMDPASTCRAFSSSSAAALTAGGAGRGGRCGGDCRGLAVPPPGASAATAGVTVSSPPAGTNSGRRPLAGAAQDACICAAQAHWHFGGDADWRSDDTCRIVQPLCADKQSNGEAKWMTFGDQWLNQLAWPFDFTILPQIVCIACQGMSDALQGAIVATCSVALPPPRGSDSACSGCYV